MTEVRELIMDCLVLESNDPVIGVHLLFDSLIAAIIAKRSVIREREWQQRDSIILKDPIAPAWGVVADEEAARQRDAIRGVCCSS